MYRVPFDFSRFIEISPILTYRGILYSIVVFLCLTGDVYIQCSVDLTTKPLCTLRCSLQIHCREVSNASQLK